MPTLKSLACGVQWADTNAFFQEYGTVYGDGVVETFIAIPDTPQAFNIRLTSRGFIFQGLAAVVFIDGHYQCNRNRVNLVPAKKKNSRTDRTEIDFLFRQKEKRIDDGTYMGREWRFDNHNTVSDFPPNIDQSHFEQLGTIEVLVMRCQAQLEDEANDSAVSSAAESDILGENEHTHGNDSSSDTDKGDSDDGNKGAGKKKGSAYQAQVVDDDEAEMGMGMMGIFDGPSDYYRDGPIRDGIRPMPGWQRPQGQRRHHYPEDAHRWSPSHSTSAQHIPPGYNSTPPYRDAYPQQPPPTISRKQVHFDHGRPGTRDPREYHDTHNDQPWTQGPRPSATPGSYEPRYDDYPGWDDGDRYGGYTAYAEGDHGYDHRTDKYPDTAFHHQLPQYGPGYAPHPAAWANGPQPNPGPGMPWPPLHPGYAAPWPYPDPNVPPRMHDPPQYPGHQQPVSWVPANGASPPAAPPAQPPDMSGNREGLDPAKDQNDTQDDSWNNDANNGNNQGGDDGWKDGGNNNNAANGTGDWQNSSAKQPADTGWGNDSNTKNDTGTQQAWDSGDASKNDNNSDNWGNNTATVQPAGPDDWGTQNAGGGGGGIAASISSYRPLYGPHGAYYDVKPPDDVDCDTPEEPRYDVPQSVAAKIGSTKQVQPGKGYVYVKKRCVPEYIDPLEEPYARFVFKYRTKDQLRNELNVNLETEPSGNQEIQELQNMNKEELIHMFLRAKVALGGKVPSPPPVEEPKDQPLSQGPMPVEPPRYACLDYKLPQGRGGAATGLVAGNAGATQGDDWGNPAGNNTSGGKADTSWETNNAGNDTGGKNNWGGDHNSGGARGNWASGTHLNEASNTTDWMGQTVKTKEAAMMIGIMGKAVAAAFRTIGTTRPEEIRLQATRMPTLRTITRV